MIKIRIKEKQPYKEREVEIDFPVYFKGGDCVEGCCWSNYIMITSDGEQRDGFADSHEICITERNNGEWELDDKRINIARRLGEILTDKYYYEQIHSSIFYDAVDRMKKVLDKVMR